MINLAVAFGLVVFVVTTIPFLLIGLLVGGWVFAPVVGLIVAVTWVSLAWLHGDATVLDLCDVEAADPVEHARLFNVTAGLGAAMGLVVPNLYVVEDLGMNALAVGRDARHASLVVTHGLLEQTNLVELEAIMALEMYRIKVGDIGAETFVVPTIGAAAVLSEAFEKWQFVSRLFAVPIPWIENMIARLHPGREELDTDMCAVQFTRYPPGLAEGLSRMAGHSALAVAAPVTAHLWAAPPIAAAARPAIARVHAPLVERIAVLQEL